MATTKQQSEAVSVEALVAEIISLRKQVAEAAKPQRPRVYWKLIEVAMIQAIQGAFTVLLEYFTTSKGRKFTQRIGPLFAEAVLADPEKFLAICRAVAAHDKQAIEKLLAA